MFFFQIGDFGMARDLMDDTYYKSSGGKIPVKWTAPEVGTNEKKKNKQKQKNSIETSRTLCLPKIERIPFMLCYKFVSLSEIYKV